MLKNKNSVEFFMGNYFNILNKLLKLSNLSFKTLVRKKTFMRTRPRIASAFEWYKFCMFIEKNKLKICLGITNLNINMYIKNIKKSTNST